MRSRIARNLEWLFAPEVPVASSMATFARAARNVVKDVVTLPAGFSAHDYAVYLLHIAAEIEHLLMVQYLYAAYSLGGAQVPAAERPHVQRWQEVILGIAKEEMAHFISVQNILRLVGGPLNLDRNDYPCGRAILPVRIFARAAQLAHRWRAISSPKARSSGPPTFRRRRSRRSSIRRWPASRCRSNASACCIP